MKIQITEKEKTFLKGCTAAAVVSMEQQLENKKLMESQLIELQSLKDAVESQLKSGDTLELTDDIRGYLIKLLRMHQLEKVESIFLKLHTK